MSNISQTITDRVILSKVWNLWILETLDVMIWLKSCILVEFENDGYIRDPGCNVLA